LEINYLDDLQKIHPGGMENTVGIEMESNSEFSRYGDRGPSITYKPIGHHLPHLEVIEKNWKNDGQSAICYMLRKESKIETHKGIKKSKEDGYSYRLFSGSYHQAFALIYDA
jgi:hypothetical protein